MNQQPRAQRARLQEQPNSPDGTEAVPPKIRGPALSAEGCPRRSDCQEALPGLVRCAQHVHAEDFLRILAGMLRQNKRRIFR